MASDTKERIIMKALEMFAEDGYGGTNLRDLAKELNLSKSALYRHYTSKEEIWIAVCERMTAYYEERFGTPEHMPFLPKTTEELYQMTMKMVDFTVHDPQVIRVRKVIVTEQFRSDMVRELANKYFLYGMEARFKKVFEVMMEHGTIKKTDPDTLAFSYTAPITALVHLCDRDPGKMDEALEKLEKFVKQFIEVYQNDIS